MYKVRKAVKTDLPVILGIYKHAREFMAANGNPTQWSAGYPSADVLNADMEAGTLYVVCDEETVRGVFMFRIGDDPTYQMIWNGDWHSAQKYGVIHRVAGDGTGGIFKACLEFCEEQVEYLRIDTHEDNTVMQHILGKNGYRRCGMILTDNGTPRIAYDRI